MFDDNFFDDNHRDMEKTTGRMIRGFGVAAVFSTLITFAVLGGAAYVIICLLQHNGVDINLFD